LTADFTDAADQGIEPRSHPRHQRNPRWRICGFEDGFGLLSFARCRAAIPNAGLFAPFELFVARRKTSALSAGSAFHSCPSGAAHRFTPTARRILRHRERVPCSEPKEGDARAEGGRKRFRVRAGET
jgi:hypothetical protein